MVPKAWQNKCLEEELLDSSWKDKKGFPCDHSVKKDKKDKVTSQRSIRMGSRRLKGGHLSNPQ